MAGTVSPAVAGSSKEEEPNPDTRLLAAFTALFQADPLQEALAFLDSAAREFSADKARWASEWAMKRARGGASPTSDAVEKARCTLVGFVRAVRDEYMPRQPDEKEKFGRTLWVRSKIRDVLALLLDLDRASAMYVMKRKRYADVPRGINWYAAGQSPGPESGCEAFHAESFPSISRAIVWLVDACALRDEFAEVLKPYYFPDSHMSHPGNPYTGEVTVDDDAAASTDISTASSS